MSTTLSYSSVHRALVDVAAEYDTQPIVARLVLALHERGGTAKSDDLEADLHTHGSMVRRGLTLMYADGIASGHGCDDGPRRRGVRTRVVLTDRGHVFARALVARVHHIEWRQAA